MLTLLGLPVASLLSSALSGLLQQKALSEQLMHFVSRIQQAASSPHLAITQLSHPYSPSVKPHSFCLLRTKVVQTMVA